jgi:hypothetical protein
VLAAIVEESEWMTAMRQCSPFAGVLDPRQRWAIYDEFAELPIQRGVAEDAEETRRKSF